VQGSYYFWKWADNDVSGRPAEVHSALLRGEQHPALELFDARPLLLRLQQAAADGRLAGEEWDWQAQPSASPEKALFVFVSCPRVNASKASVKRFYNRFIPLAVSGYDEQEGHVISCLRPKLNCFICGQFQNEPAYDITPEDIPDLLCRIRPGEPQAWGELWNRWNDAVVASAQGRRFRVEWRDVFGEKIPGQLVQWRARDMRRLRRLNGQDDTKALPERIDPDFLIRADALTIFNTFLRGEPRPARYCWRKLKGMSWT
jgi:hypothetical protein